MGGVPHPEKANPHRAVHAALIQKWVGLIVKLRRWLGEAWVPCLSIGGFGLGLHYSQPVRPMEGSSLDGVVVVRPIPATIVQMLLDGDGCRIDWALKSVTSSVLEVVTQ